MSTMVRCLEGHAFDADATATCPDCGSPVFKAASASKQGEKKAPGERPLESPRSSSPKVVVSPKVADASASDKSFKYWGVVAIIALLLGAWIYRGLADGSLRSGYERQQAAHPEKAPMSDALNAVIEKAKEDAARATEDKRMPRHDPSRSDTFRKQANHELDQDTIPNPFQTPKP